MKHKQNSVFQSDKMFVSTELLPNPSQIYGMGAISMKLRNLATNFFRRQRLLLVLPK